MKCAYGSTASTAMIEQRYRRITLLVYVKNLTGNEETR